MEDGLSFFVFFYLIVYVGLWELIVYEIIIKDRVYFIVLDMLEFYIEEIDLELILD